MGNQEQIMKLQAALNQINSTINFVEQQINYWESERPFMDKRFAKLLRTRSHYPFRKISMYLSDCHEALTEMHDYLEYVVNDDSEDLCKMSIEKQDDLIEQKDPMTCTVLMDKPILDLKILRLEEFGKEQKIICSLPTKSRIKKHIQFLKWGRFK